MRAPACRGMEWAPWLMLVVHFAARFPQNAQHKGQLQHRPCQWPCHQLSTSDGVREVANPVKKDSDPVRITKIRARARSIRSPRTKRERRDPSGLEAGLPFLGVRETQSTLLD